jgi:hypothetical protein
MAAEPGSLMAAILQHEQDAFSYTAAGMFVVVDHFLLLENGSGTSGILSNLQVSVQEGFGTEMSEVGVKLGCHRNGFLECSAQS